MEELLLLLLLEELLSKERNVVANNNLRQEALRAILLDADIILDSEESGWDRYYFSFVQCASVIVDYCWFWTLTPQLYEIPSRYEMGYASFLFCRSTSDPPFCPPPLLLRLIIEYYRQ
jgi:hypothetical protein